MRLIDADAFRHRVLCQPHNMSVNEVLELISTMPTADVVERKRGKWMVQTYRVNGDDHDRIAFYICSECGCTNWTKDNYCPNCGAEMLKGEDNE